VRSAAIATRRGLGNRGQLSSWLLPLQQDATSLTALGGNAVVRNADS